MPSQTLAMKSRVRPGIGGIVIAAAVVVVVVAMVLDTTVVQVGSSEDTRQAGFSPETYGKTEFPKVQAAVEKNAVDAATLAGALLEDQSAAADKYAVKATMGPEFSVKFTGVAGEGKSGIYTVKVPDVPDDVTIRVQTGPAINGTDLRDAIGTIKFGQFKNQIEYQNAGSALNNEMKQQVLSRVDASDLTGKTISVVGAFLMFNPKNWLVTPVSLSVQQ